MLSGESEIKVTQNQLSMSPGAKRKQLLIEQSKIGLHSFKFLKVIGKGSFGKVCEMMYLRVQAGWLVEVEVLWMDFIF